MRRQKRYIGRVENVEQACLFPHWVISVNLTFSSHFPSLLSGMNQSLSASMCLDIHEHIHLATFMICQYPKVQI